MTAYDTPLTVTGPYRRPRQMLAEQSIHGHTSIHDDATAAALALTGAPIEGPTLLASVLLHQGIFKDSYPHAPRPEASAAPATG